MPCFKDRKDFCPDYTPLQMFRHGVFGGSYFRPIQSGVAGKKVNGPSQKVKAMLKSIPPEKLTSEYCDKSINKYKFKTAQSLKEWERKGWIHPTGNNSDLYGWVGWYCEFYKGRRIPEIDDIQIARFNGVKSRFGGMYKKYKTDKLRQLLLQWAIKT